MNWLQALREIICRIYEEWGGDCEALGQLPWSWIETVEEVYQQQGIGGIPADRRDELAGMLDELEAHLGMTDNALSEGENQSLANLIASIRKDLEGAGGDS